VLNKTDKGMEKEKGIANFRVLPVKPQNWPGCFGDSAGSALILAFVTLMVLISICISLTSVTVVNYHMDHVENDYQTAYYVAEGALRHQVECMRIKMEELYASGIYDDASGFFAAFIDGLSSVTPPVFKGDFNKKVDVHVNVMPEAGEKDDTMTFSVQATGIVGKISRELKSTVKIRWAAPNTVFGYALFANGSIGIGSNAEIHGDSATNTTASGGVLLGNGSKIYGNIFIGPGGNPAQVVQNDGKYYMTGRIKVNNKKIKLLTGVPPSGMERRGNLIVNDEEIRSINGGGRFDKIEVNSGGKLIIYLDGDTIIHANSIYVQDNGVVELRGIGRLSVYADDMLDIGSKAVINGEGQPDELFVLYFGDRITIKDNTVFNGGLYAPYALVCVGSSTGIRGNVVANEASLNPNARLYFDSVIKADYPMPVKDNMIEEMDEELFSVIFNGEQ
jgi:hypothetical protein